MSTTGKESDLALRQIAGPNAHTVGTERWAPLAARMARRHQVPVSWVLAVIYAESGGNPRAVAPDGGIGLMQIMPGSHRTTKRAMLDPQANVDKGTSILRQLMKLGLDLPPAASGYNAGLDTTQKPHVSTQSPWGMRETTGHIDRVVKANNWFVGRIEQGALDLEGPPVKLIGGLTFLVCGGVAWLVCRLG